MPLVHAVNVHKSFYGVEVLKGIDIDVAAGEVICLLGPSGSGKTTFLRCINQLETIQGGRIWIDGELAGYEEKNGRLHRLNDKRIAAQRREIGMVFQRFNLFPHKTALANIMEAPVHVAASSSSAWGSASAATPTRPSSPGASSSGSPSPGHWPWTPS
jgi:polar amino acid transport system ATP-binding protein